MDFNNFAPMLDGILCFILSKKLCVASRVKIIYSKVWVRTWPDARPCAQYIVMFFFTIENLLQKMTIIIPQATQTVLTIFWRYIPIAIEICMHVGDLILDNNMSK